METMQPALRIGRHVWDRINMPQSEFDERIRRIRQAMHQESIDIVLLYGDAFDAYGHPCYASNYIIRLPRGAMMLLPRNGEPVLFFEGAARGLPFAKTLTWVDEVKPCPDVAKASLTYLREKSMLPATIACAGCAESMPYYQVQLLDESLADCRVVNFDHVMRGLRMVKSDRECDQIRRASRIVTRMFGMIGEIVAPAMNMRGLEARLYREARLDGAGDIRILLAQPGETDWSLGPPEDETVAPGASLIVYVAVSFEGYWSEGIRTFLFKDGSLVASDAEHLHAVYEEMVAALQPGKLISKYCEDIRREIERRKLIEIPDYGLGGGIGLSLQEYPILVTGEEQPIGQGMCFTLRLGLRDEKRGAMMIGNTLYVAHHGAEVLTV